MRTLSSSISRVFNLRSRFDFQLWNDPACVKAKAGLTASWQNNSSHIVILELMNRPMWLKTLNPCCNHPHKWGGRDCKEDAIFYASRSLKDMGFTTCSGQWISRILLTSWTTLVRTPEILWCEEPKNVKRSGGDCRFKKAAWVHRFYQRVEFTIIDTRLRTRFSSIINMRIPSVILAPT